MTTDKQPIYEPVPWTRKPYDFPSLRELLEEIDPNFGMQTFKVRLEDGTIKDMYLIDVVRKGQPSCAARLCPWCTMLSLVDFLKKKNDSG